MMVLTREEKARIAKRRYMREWRRKNRERKKQHEQKYWAKRYDELYGDEEAQVAE